MKSIVVLFCLAGVASSSPLSLNRENPHYFEYRGKATVLVTSGEHYGAVINQDFDYRRYLEELARNHLNLTRVWSGSYREEPGNFHIGNNTLAPKPERFVSPWLRSEKPGALDGSNRFDLKRWNPAYFARLRDFLREASRRGVVVELDLFCTFYEDSMWNVSPLNAANNVNGIGDVPRTEVLSMEHSDLLEVEDELVRKIVTEANSFDNLYFEICNEPYWGKVSAEWQRHISGVIADTEKRLPQRHLISENVANGAKKVENLDPHVSIFNFHYARPPAAVGLNYGLDRVIGFNETGFDGQDDSTYRVQGWAFLAAGGALYNNLDYSFAVGHEGGDFPVSKETPGGGGRELRKQLGVMAEFFRGLPLAELRPAGDAVTVRASDGAHWSVLAAPGKVYVIYLYRAGVQPGAKPHFVFEGGEARASQVSVRLPSGKYKAVWREPKSGSVLRTIQFEQKEETRLLSSPPFSEDVVLKIERR